MRLLLDENISPALVGLSGEIDVYAQSVPHVGLGGRADRVVWQYALDHDFAVVTANAQDFIELLDMPVHPGLIGSKGNVGGQNRLLTRSIGRPPVGQTAIFAKTKPGFFSIHPANPWDTVVAMTRLCGFQNQKRFVQ